jgi:predicted N-formylglutamate amidohydrolase
VNFLKPEPGTALILTCEHATADVPPPYRERFRSEAAQAALASHRGWDPHAHILANHLHTATGAPLVVGTATRLLVELNRSPHHPALWSEFTRALPWSTREHILRTLYFPYRRQVVDLIRQHLRRSPQVLHLSLHTFTPTWHGQPRPIDIALLFDPQRPAEAAYATRWHTRLSRHHPHLRLAHNAPYHGTDDGLTTTLRQHFGPRYLGIELEWNQALPPEPTYL